MRLFERHGLDVGVDPDAERLREGYVMEPGGHVVVMDGEAHWVFAAHLHDLVVGRMAGIELAAPDKRVGTILPSAVDRVIISGRALRISAAEQAARQDVALLPAGIRIERYGIRLLDDRPGLGRIADVPGA